MKKRVISMLVSVGLLAGMLVVTAGPAAAASTSTADWNYSPLNVATVIGPATAAPNGIPLCKSGSLGSLVCYSPSFIKTAYDYPSNLDGNGQTIVIVDAYGSPTIASDLALFDAMFHLPAPPSFTILCGNGSCPATNGLNPKHDPGGWATETSLDVEYAHAMAPGANIVLDVAASSSGNAINDAEATAIALYPGAIFSQSFGIPEAYIKAGSNNAQVMQGQKNYVAGIAKGDTFFASAGDTGADFGFGYAMSEFPSSDLHNTSVTGTQGLPYLAPGTLVDCPSGATCTAGLATYQGPCLLGRTTLPVCTPVGYGGEQVWNEPQFAVATGGAPSLLFGVPSYQAGLGLTMRGPDVAYNAAIDGGVLVVQSPYLYFVGGTSAGSPQWAGIAALVNQARALAGKGPIGDLNPALYAIYHSSSYASDFHDITVGNDKLVGSTVGYSAGPGYDLASGIGSPNVANLVASLAAR
jgi:subtilase family serine protease